ncbi:Mannosyltransferase [Vibrio chagasii]|uniref:glycosyltransferase family 32 protein n=1 Tax=Vibrio chagasii TaxID=170679 RepID=UPI0033860FA8|nr:Mannosyltransferase [Vibrio chagasii]CAH7028217.1 Mannosyltransferase [Vibrio chagasii]
MKQNKTIHAIWLGGTPNSFSNACIDDWEKQGFTYKLWLDDNPIVIDLINGCEFARECYKRKLYAFVTDYLRLKILSIEGGLYLDTDVTISNNPFPLFEGVRFAAGWESDKFLGNAIIYADKESKILAKIVDFYENEIMNSPLYMGPKILSHKLTVDAFQDLEPCRLFDQAYFYAYDGEKLLNINSHIPRYMTHWYQHSWKSNKGIVFLKSKHKGLWGKLYTYQKYFFKIKGKFK